MKPRGNPSLISRGYWRLSNLLTRRGLDSFVRRELQCIPAGGRILSVGAGGALGRAIQSYCESQSIYHRSLDIDPERRPDIIGNISSVDLKSERFDCIFLIEVLEHIPEPHRAIENIYNNLENMGRVVASVPFLFPLHDTPGDYFRFTKFGLQHLFRKFSNVKIQSRNRWATASLSIFVRIYFEDRPLCKVLGLLLLPFCLIWAAERIDFT